MDEMEEIEHNPMDHHRNPVDCSYCIRSFSEVQINNRKKKYGH